MSTYEYKNKLYIVSECSIDEIPSHIERVFSYWAKDNTDIQVQKDLMEECITDGIALKITSNDMLLGSVYLLHIDKDTTSYTREDDYKGIQCFVKTKSAFALLMYHLREKLSVCRILFQPHCMNPVPFGKWLTESSIRNHYSFRIPIIANLYNKDLDRRIPDIKEV